MLHNLNNVKVLKTIKIELKLQITLVFLKFLNKYPFSVILEENIYSQFSLFPNYSILLVYLGLFEVGMLPNID